MTTLEIPATALWAERFARPGLEDLLREVGEDNATPFEMVREGLLARGLREDLDWHGPSYRWSFRYAQRKQDKPLFYLVPRPTAPFLAAPVEIETLASIKASTLDRAFRETLLGSSVVGPNAWCNWAIASKTGADALLSGLAIVFGWDD